MRFLGVDLGLRRIGLAVSDSSATLARPWKTIPAGVSPVASAAAVAALLADSGDPDLDTSAFEGVVVGVPRRLNGDPTDLTQPSLDCAAALADLSGLVVRLQDERLTSVEAESRLSVNFKDWRDRKARIDAAAAAIILQDYLDGRAHPGRAADDRDGVIRS